MGATPTRTATTRDDLKEAVDELIDKVVNGDDRHWQEYAARLADERALGARIGMYKPWSVNNMFYLHAQVKRRKQSVKGLYAGVKQWSERGRSVREGEKPYIIFGPPGYFRRQQQQQNGAAPAAAGQPQAAQAGANPAANPAEREYVHCRPKTIEVFDWTQTVADDPDYVEPDWGVPLATGDLDTLYLLAETSPVPVRFLDIGSRNEHGWLDKSGITVDASMPVGNRIFTLLHELGHYHLGHLEQVNATTPPSLEDQDGYSVYAACEQEAALAQFLAMKMLGLDESVGNDITEAAGAYLRSWLRVDDTGKVVPVEGHRTKRKLILKRFDTAFKAADKIVTTYLEAVAAREETPAVALAPVPA